MVSGPSFRVTERRRSSKPLDVVSLDPWRCVSPVYWVNPDWRRQTTAASPDAVWAHACQFHG